MLRQGAVRGTGREVGKTAAPRKLWALPSAQVEHSQQGSWWGWGLAAPLGSRPEEWGCSHLYPPALQLEYSGPQGTDPAEEVLPVFHR